MKITSKIIKRNSFILPVVLMSSVFLLNCFSESARSAYEFKETAGTNYGLRDISTYGPMVADLGTKYVRFGKKWLWTDVQPYGLKILYLVNCVDGNGDPDPSGVQSWLDAARPYVDQIVGIEGVNEKDYGDPSNWVQPLIDFQQALYEAVKGDPDFAHIPVLEPALHNPHNQLHLADMAPYFDISNMHAYPGAEEPSSHNGWHIDLWVSKTTEMFPDKPIWITETGYNIYHSDGTPALSEEGEAKYLPRLYLYTFNHPQKSVDKIFDYRFHDTAGHGDHDWGMLDEYASPRESYQSLKNLLALLNDQGANAASFTPGSLDYQLSGDTDDLFTVLLQKSDGSFWLALWQAVPSYDKSEGFAPIYNADAEVTLTLPDPMNITTYLPFEDIEAVEHQRCVQEISLDVPDHVLLVKMSPTWMAKEVGSTGLSGTAAHSEGTYTVSGSGHQIAGTADSFYFLNQPTNREEVVTLEVSDLQSAGQAGKVGVMLRDNVNANNQFAAVFVHETGDVTFEWRSWTSSVAQEITVSGVSAPIWLRLEEQGKTYSGYYSSNGTSWTLIGSQDVDFGDSATYAGVAITSNNNSQVCTATLKNLNLRPSNQLHTLYLNAMSIDAYNSQDVIGDIHTEEGLEMTGNLWKRIHFDYNITANTIIEFDFCSSIEGEIQGIGLDNNTNQNDVDRIFKLYGTQQFGITDFNDYTGTDWKHYIIPIGHFYTGQMKWLTFILDDDQSPINANSSFANLRIYESAQQVNIHSPIPMISNPSLNLFTLYP